LFEIFHTPISFATSDLNNEIFDNLGAIN